MVRMTIRHLRERKGRNREFVGYYYVPTAKMVKAGIHPEALGRERAAAVARAEELNAEWDAIRRDGKEPETVRDGSVKWLIREYQKSTWFTGLAARTQSEGTRHLSYIGASFLGPAHVRQVSRRHIRDFYEKIAAAKGLARAKETLKWLRRALSYAVELERIKVNPAFEMAIKSPPLRRIVWRPAEIAAFIAKALEDGYRGWALAVQLGYDTGQRLSDVLHLTWGDFDGEGLTFRQGKKDGEEVWVPLSAESLRMIADAQKAVTVLATARDRTHILMTLSGRALTNRSYFGRVFRKLRRALDLPPIQYRDLRRTAGTEANATSGDSDTLLGHRPGSPVKRHYIVPNKAAARRVQKARWDQKVENGEPKS